MDSIRDVISKLNKKDLVIITTVFPYEDKHVGYLCTVWEDDEVLWISHSYSLKRQYMFRFDEISNIEKIKGAD